MSSRLRLHTAVLLLALCAYGATPSVAQQVEPQAEEADSTRLRILERIRRLGRAPGEDSVLFVQDSVRMARAAAGIRPGSGAGLDSIAQALLAMPGYLMTEYQGQSANFDAQDRVLVLTAPESQRARLTQEAMQMEADTSITFNQATGRLRGIGNPTATMPQGDPVSSSTMVFDINEGRGSALDAETTYMQQGARWIVRGDMPFAAQDSSFMSHARFTSCDLEVPHSHFETDEIKIVGGRVLVARGVRLHFADVPVFWLPFVAQSLSSGRASGLLTPRFSVNDIVRTSSGHRRRVSNIGFYWAMSDYSDALFALDWFSQTFVSVTGSGQYRFNRQFLSGDANVRHYWREGTDGERGDREFAIDTQHSWQPDERTDMRISGRYATSTDFVRENSFNPREVTQSIDSEGGVGRRFDWGMLSLAANRRAYLSDDRTEWTLPSANLSLSPITIFAAPVGTGQFWNNMTWSGSATVRRGTVDRALPDTFSIAQASTATNDGSVSSNLSIGNLTFSQNANATRNETLRVPEAFIANPDSADPTLLVPSAPARDIAQETLAWTSTVNYQQQLIGSTTLTPRLSLSGNMLRSDTSSVARDFVSAPSRLAFGAQLKTDIYGFFPGFAGYETVRHKLSPSFDYQWSPAKTPSDLQRQVFGSRALQPQNAISITLNQTFEAKRAAPPPQPGAPGGGAAPAGALDSLSAPPDSLAAAPADSAQTGPRRVQQAQIVNLLSLRTSVVRYDFVQADSAGSFIHGFETTRLSNQISSDILRGLSVSTEHDLFRDEPGTSPAIPDRRFDPHLSQVNLSFSLGSSSALFRWLGLSGDGSADEPEPAQAGGPLDTQSVTDESSIIPGGGMPGAATRPSPSSGTAGTWTASFSYSLQRPRAESQPARQMLTGTLQLQPTDNWNLSWQTAYDIERGSFADHSIRLTRDLHEWQANFDFLQTATGNWSFRFEVSLLANRDLKFDYDQQNLDLGLPSGQR